MSIKQGVWIHGVSNSMIGKGRWTAMLEEDYNKLKEENSRLKKKLGWKKIKSVEQMEALKPGTYGFMDKNGNNAYGVIGFGAEDVLYFYGHRISSLGVVEHYKQRAYGLNKSFISYRHIHSWYPAKKKDSRQEVYDALNRQGNRVEIGICPDITSLRFHGTIEELAELLGISEEEA